MIERSFNAELTGIYRVTLVAAVKKPELYGNV